MELLGPFDWNYAVSKNSCRFSDAICKDSTIYDMNVFFEIAVMTNNQDSHFSAMTKFHDFP